MSFNPPPLPPMQPQWGQFQVWWQQILSGLKETLDAQQTAIDALAAAVAAQATADAVKQQNAISAGWTVPSTVVTATDAGTDVTVTVLAHVRHYDDGTAVSVNSHNFTGKAYGTAYAVYYDDPTRSDTTPNYQITTNLALAQANQANGRHRVGALTTPTAGSPPTSGGSTPPGTSSHGPDYEIP